VLRKQDDSNAAAEQANHYTDALTAAFAVLAQSPETAPACDTSVQVIAAAALNGT
jgi:plasmid stabilization system protein ParE